MSYTRLYRLDKINISDLINQIDDNLNLTFILSNDGPNLVKSNKSLSMFLSGVIHLSSPNVYIKENYKKYKYRFCITNNTKDLKLNNLISVLNRIDMAYKVTVKVKTGYTYVKGTQAPKREPSGSVIYDLIRDSKSSKNLKDGYDLTVIVESDYPSICQYFKTLAPGTITGSFFIFPKHLKLSYIESLNFLDLKSFKNQEVKDVKGIKIGLDNRNKPLSLSYDALYRHLKVEGVNGSGKSGALISLAVKLIDEKNNVVFIDPHNQTAIEVYKGVENVERVKVLRVKNNDKYLGFNPLICYGNLQQRLEHAESVTQAFFSQEIEDRYLTTVEYGRAFITAFVEFNYCYLEHLKKSGYAKDEIEKIIKEKQLTVNDLVRLQSDESLRLLIANTISNSMSGLAKSFLRFNEVYSKTGLDASLMRFKEAVNSTIGVAFFESRGYLTTQNTQKNLSILCLLNELTPMSRGIVSKLCFSHYFQLHKQNILKDKTFLLVDEAVTSKLPNMLEIITESRKFGLHLTLAYQGLSMWNKDEKEAIDLIPNELEFSTNNNPKPVRSFELTSIDQNETVKGVTLDYPKSKRDYIESNEGQSFNFLYDKIQKKTNNITEYFYELKDIKR